jgi:hypothetical protein
MTKEQLTNIMSIRRQAREQFEIDFNNVETIEQLASAYAKFAGKLEGILDIIEMQEGEKILWNTQPH